MENKEYARKWYKLNREKKLELSREYSKTHREMKRKSTKEWKKRNPEKVKIISKRSNDKNREKINEKNRKGRYKAQLKYMYGITEEYYKNMVELQEGKCLICGFTSDRRLYVDHNHITGKIRGLLCMKCNAGLGMFQDNPVIIKNAYNYICDIYKTISQNG